MKSYELGRKGFPDLGKAARNACIAVVAVICCAWTTAHVWRARGTFDMGVAEAIQALTHPTTDDERKVVVAALRRNACLAAMALVEESGPTTAAGREAAAALDHLREVLH